MPPKGTKKEKQTSTSPAKHPTPKSSSMPFLSPLAMLQANYGNQGMAQIVKQYAPAPNMAPYGPMSMLYNQMKSSQPATFPSYMMPMPYMPANKQQTALQRFNIAPAQQTPVAVPQQQSSLIDRIMSMLPGEKLMDDTKKEMASAAFGSGSVDFYELLKRSGSSEDLHAYIEDKRWDFDPSLPWSWG